MLSSLALRRGSVALAATLALAGAAQAGYVVINADPLFTSSPLVGYGWSATGALYVPDSCLQSGGYSTSRVTFSGSASSTPCDFGQMSLSDVSVTFYRADGSGVAAVVPVGSYAPFIPTNDVSPTQTLTDVTFSTGEDGYLSQVVGVTTSTSYNYTVSLANLGSSDPATLDVSFFLHFNLVEQVTSTSDLTVGEAAATTGVPIGFTGNGSTLDYTVGGSDYRSASTQVTASTTLTDNPLTAPTPGTLALALLAGVAAWTERRRLPRGR